MFYNNLKWTKMYKNVESLYYTRKLIKYCISTVLQVFTKDLEMDYQKLCHLYYFALK